ELISAEERGQGRTNAKDYYTECYGAVQETFKGYPNVRVVQGIIPASLAQVTSEQVSYLSIDMNCVVPEIAAAEFFWDRLVSGAVMVLDDYGFELHEPQKRAFDAFAARRGVQVLSMPTGQGLIFKP
ncbi:MAG: MtfD protein, partial [Desulfovibrio sp.]|nr:MtfD protein [Desulfovibrio sp.]